MSEQDIWLRELFGCFREVLQSMSKLHDSAKRPFFKTIQMD